MRRNTIETVLGGVVIAVAGFFLVFAYTSADLRRVEGYEVSANFSSVGGLQNGSDVRISGVKVGTVTSQTLDPSTYLAVVRMTIDPSIKLPKDTVALIASESLLGGKYMALEPGGDPDMIQPGGRIDFTQSTPGLEQLLGQVIFSMQGGGPQGQEQGQGEGAPPAPPAAGGAQGGGLLGN
ncbi:outer membrane lipid asymmetry maintenance protein MlaD [Skermanella sp. TT6]|uniref:Outer membrane lipid asymmetry maintenance protein MlaD n=1 Tax=Skermanella cutis TaxID=2775420 RepID=A0ABX7B270_9PROT|nr:outer membrane lipid asymmetry maintenance protein MlaD [Skermanella sp. TT6]QQP88207.1 outer membrane lipid asymmetry maintenance protein MlaD [Skermanella sp. TT6]